MKKYLLTFLRRGLLAACGGPLILALIYWILGAQGTVTVLTPHEAALGIATVTLLAFVAGGISVVYEIERMALLPATLIHAAVLYLDYLLIYLLNNWIPKSLSAIAIFTAIYAGGYLVIWACIMLSIRAKTRRLNRLLKNACCPDETA